MAMKDTALGRHIEGAGLSMAALAKSVGCAHQTMRKYAQGARTPPPWVAFKIIKATHGALNWSDFYGNPLADAEPAFA